VISLRIQRADFEAPWRELGLRPDGRWGRWWQVTIAVAGLLILLPVSLLVALAIKLTSRGPILYRGSRIGRDLRPFTIYKFRTLLVDAEGRIGARLLSPDEPLYTPVGRFLKRSKLDEIPQLLNVLRGDMNLVGPRPIRPIFLATSTRDIANYTIIEHDGVIFGCAALYPYPEAHTAEMAALTVSPQVQGQGDGERILKRIEQRAKAQGLDSIFVLTTRTMHWFIKRGFEQVDPEWLPEARKKKYNWDRRSQVLVKKLA